MYKQKIYKFSLLLLLVTAAIYAQAQITTQFLSRYSIGTYNSNGGVAEISAYDPSTKRMYVVNGPDSSFRIVNMANPANPTLISTISVKPYGIDVTSITTNKRGLIAIAVIDSNGKTNPSSIVFLDANGTFISRVKAGANTDHIIFTPNGNRLLCANEGEPNVGYTIDPEGSVSIINVSGGAASLTQANVQTAGFTAYNAPAVIDPRIRIFGRIQSGGVFLRNSTVAEDMEPEYITISEDNTTAWVTCQENNAVAVLNINTGTITSLISLGFKNHNLVGNGLDPSDRSLNNTTAQAAIANWPVFGMYMPDGISSYRVGSQTFLVTANEGDARADWGVANNEEVRMADVTYVLDTVKFGGASGVAALKANGALGRLNVTNRYGDFNNDGKFDSIFTFGARSFSIWNGSTGLLVWDSKDDFEQRTLAIFPNNFNCGHTTNALDDRSDNKGPEPESVTIGKILDSTYAFVGLERIGGIMIYNITNPNAPYYVQYINTRDFSVTPGQGTLASVGDLGPEGIAFIPRNESPNGKDLVLLSNEVSGTVAIFQVNSRSNYQMQILHSGDMESGLAAVVDAPNYAAIVDRLEDQHVNTLMLSSGDNTLPGPFLSSGEDPSLQTPLRNTSARYYSGTQSLRPAIGRADIAIMNVIGFNASALGNHEFDLGTTDLNGQIGVDIRSSGADKRWIGAQFPYVSCNLNFSNDVNLNYLFTNQILRDTAFRTSPTITANAQKRGIAPSVIIERNGEKIGIVGATTQILARISSPGFTTVNGVQVDNMPALAAIIQPVVDSLIVKEGVNKIILLAHLQQIANEKALAPLLRNVDIIISGGNHAITADGNDRLLPGNVATEQYPIRTASLTNQPMIILNNSSEWKYVGRFVCDFDSIGVLLPNLLDSTVNGVYASDSISVTSLWGNYAEAFLTGTKGADVRTICNAVNSVIASKDGNIIGKSTVFLEGRRNFVRTEETNLGNLSSDANLWYAKQIDPQVRVSLKNGGGIRSAVGFVNAVGANVILQSTQANPSVGKVAGDISQLDVENSLRFNNSLVIVTTNASGLKRLLEHGVAAATPNATPGQFPQVGGVSFSYDTTRPASNRIVSMVIIDSIGTRQDTIVRNGMLFGDTSRIYKIVTLNFLANPTSVGSLVGGDNYPFPQVVTARVNLDTAIKTNGTASFAGIGSEQDAFAEFMLARHNTAGTAFSRRDTTLQGDTRIQLLNARADSILFERPLLTLTQARVIAQPAIVRTRGIVTRAWGRFIYIQDATGAIGVRQSAGAMVDSITFGRIRQGDSVEVVGPRSDFNNYAQIQLLNGAFTTNNTVIKLASNRPLPQVQVLTVKQLLSNPEAYESELIRIVNLRTGSTGNFAASTSYNVWDGSTLGDTAVLRVLSAVDTEIEDSLVLAIPSGRFTFEGTLNQFCSLPTSGCATGYQLQGVRKAEIIDQTIPLTTLTQARSSAPPSLVRTRGIVTRAWGRFIYIQDATGAVGVRQSAGSMVDSIVFGGLKQGDSVEVIGTRSDFNNYAQILLASGVFTDSSTVIKLATNRPLPAVQILTVKQLLANPEAYESELIRITNLSITGSGAFAASTNYNVWDGSTTGDTTVLRVISAVDTEIEDAPALNIPAGQFTFEGTLIQFCSSPTLGCLTGYQLQGVRKADIIPQILPLGLFTLVTPATNTQLVTNSSNTTPVNITWTRSSNAIRYRWYLDIPAGNFNPGLHSQLSNNAGVDTVLTLTVAQIDTLLSSLAIVQGDSISTKWTVKAFSATDSLLATQSFILKLVRQAAPITLRAFGLLQPANNARLVSSPGSTIPVNVIWQNGRGIQYKWILTSANGTFTNPLLVLPSNILGTDTTLTLTSGVIDAVLAGLGINKGDSAITKWTVYAYRGTDSLKATADFNLTLVRARTLSAFNLLSPPNNTRVEVRIGEATPVVISWQTSTGATRYNWLATLPGGSFDIPLVTIPSNNGGFDAQLTLTSGGVADLLAANGINVGDSITLIWTVRAVEGSLDSLLARQVFNITLVRLLPIGLAEQQLKSGISIYPIPSKEVLNVTSKLNGNHQYEIRDIQGKMIIKGTFDSQAEISLEQLSIGTYIISIIHNDAVLVTRFIKN